MNKPYEPSPLEIWRQCIEIQATWARDEERERGEVADERSRPPNLQTRAADRDFGPALNFSMPLQQPLKA